MLHFILQITQEENELVARLYLELGNKMLAVSRRILHSEADAQDAVHAAFVRITENIERIVKLPAFQVAPYCIVIVRNVSLRMLQKSNKVVYTDCLEQVQSGTADTAEDEAALKMQRDALLEMVAMLPPADRQLLLLHWEAGLSFSEIADYLDITEAAAKKRGQRIVKRLREQMESERSYVGIL